MKLNLHTLLVGKQLGPTTLESCLALSKLWSHITHDPTMSSLESTRHFENMHDSPKSFIEPYYLGIYKKNTQRTKMKQAPDLPMCNIKHQKDMELH